MKFCISRRLDAQKEIHSCVCRLSVLLVFEYEMLPGSIFVLPIDSPLFSLAFVHFKRQYQFTALLFCFVQMEANVLSVKLVVRYYLLHVIQYVRIS